MKQVNVFKVCLLIGVLSLSSVKCHGGHVCEHDAIQKEIEGTITPQMVKEKIQEKRMLEEGADLHNIRIRIDTSGSNS